MLEKTKAIALHTIKYSDNSIIVNLYTEKFGKQSFLLKGVYGKKSPIRANLFSPLNILELEVYHKTSGSLNKLKEALNSPVFQSIPFEPVKISISFFIAEFLQKVCQEEMPNEGLFSFLFHAIQILDVISTEKVINFHLVFLIGLSKYTGFFPDNNYTKKVEYFDLLNGSFKEYIPEHGHYLKREYGFHFSMLISSGFENIDQLKIGRNERNHFLEKLIEYFRLHIPGMSGIKSLQVLKELYD